MLRTCYFIYLVFLVQGTRYENYDRTDRQSAEKRHDFRDDIPKAVSTIIIYTDVVMETLLFRYMVCIILTLMPHLPC